MPIPVLKIELNPCWLYLVFNSTIIIFYCARLGREEITRFEIKAFVSSKEEGSYQGDGLGNFYLHNECIYTTW